MAENQQSKMKAPPPLIRGAEAVRKNAIVKETVVTPEQERKLIAENRAKAKDAKLDSWNLSVLRSNAQKSQDASIRQSDVYGRIKEDNDAARKEVIDLLSADESGVVSSAIATFKVAQDNNDFYNIGKKLRAKKFEPNNEWISTVSNRDTVVDMLNGNEIPESYSVIASETKSPEEFMEFVQSYKDDQARKRYIDTTIGSTGKVVGSVAGALTGLDTVAGIIMPWTFVNKGRKILNTANDVESTLRAEKAIAASKRTATISGLGYAVTAPLVKNWAYDDYTFTDGVIDAVAFGAIDTAFITRRLMSAQQRELSDTLSTYRMREALDRADYGVPLLGYNPMKALPNLGQKEPFTDTEIYSYKNDDIIINYPKGSDKIGYVERLGITMKPSNNASGIKANASEVISKIDNRISEISKMIDDLNGQIFGKRKVSTYKKEAMAKQVDELSDELKSLSTTKIGINKTKRVSKVQSKLNSAKLKFPSVFSDDVIDLAMDAEGDFAKAIDDISSNKDVADSADEMSDVLKSNNAKAFSAKVNKDGTVDIGVKQKDGKFKSLAKSKKGKMAMAIGALAVSSSIASADDGEGNIVTEFASYALWLALAGFVGKEVFDFIGANKGIKNAARQVADNFTKARTDKAVNSTPEGEYVGRMYGLHKQSMKAMGYIFQETVMTASDNGKKLIKDLVWDTENTYMPSAWFIKNRQHNENMTKFYSAYNPAWDAFAKSKKLSSSSRFEYYSNYSKYKREFNDMVTMLAENPSMPIPKGMENIVSETRKILDDIIDRAESNGVSGFEKSSKTGKAKNYNENYITRVLRADEIYSTIKLADNGSFSKGGKSYEALRSNLARMYENAHMTNNPKAIEEFVDSYMAFIVEKRGSLRGIGDMLGDTSSRAKFRVPLDTTQWEDIVTTINGKEVTIGLDSLFDRDIENLMMGYSNSMEGHIALAKKDYKSYTDAMAIGELEIGSAKKNIGIAINNIIGRPAYEIKNDGFSQFMKASANIATGSFMYLSAVMQIKEAGSTAIRAAKNYDTFKQTVTEFKNVLKARGSDDAVVNFIMDMTSQGNHMLTHKLHSRIYDDVANIHENDLDGAFGRLLKYSERFRDGAMIAYGIAPITDLGQRMNGMLNLDLLAKIAYGQVKLTKTEKEAYGITDDIITKAKKYLKLNSQKNLHIDSVMSLEKNSADYDEISNVLFNMGQTQMLQPTLGTTPAMFVNSAMGSVFGTLLSYAMNAHAIYGTNLVKGINRGEVMAYADMMMWFGTMMAAQMLKDEIKGVERDEEELIMAALVNTPLSAPFALSGIVAGEGVAFSANEMLQTSAMSSVGSIVDSIEAGE